MKSCTWPSGNRELLRTMVAIVFSSVLRARFLLRLRHAGSNQVKESGGNKSLVIGFSNSARNDGNMRTRDMKLFTQSKCWKLGRSYPDDLRNGFWLLNCGINEITADSSCSSHCILLPASVLKPVFAGNQSALSTFRLVSSISVYT